MEVRKVELYEFDELDEKTQQKVLSELKKYSEYLTSEEAIKETIEINEMRFLKDGTLFNY